MKFRSTTGQDVHIGLTSGHTVIITPEGVELDKMFHREAIARECLPVGMDDAKAAPKPDFDRKQVITDALKAMLDGSEAEDFTAAGKPNLKRLQSRVGFHAERSEVEAIWDAMTETPAE